MDRWCELEWMYRCRASSAWVSGWVSEWCYQLNCALCCTQPGARELTAHVLVRRDTMSTGRQYHYDPLSLSLSLSLCMCIVCVCVCVCSCVTSRLRLFVSSWSSTWRTWLVSIHSVCSVGPSWRRRCHSVSCLQQHRLRSDECSLRKSPTICDWDEPRWTGYLPYWFLWPLPAPIPNSKENAVSGGYTGCGNFAIFHLNRRLSRKRCEIGRWLLWNVNRKSWVLGWMVSFSMTLSDP